MEEEARFTALFGYAPAAETYIDIMPEIPVAVVSGDSREEVENELSAVAKVLLDEMRKNGFDLPEPQQYEMANVSVRLMP